MPLVRVGELPDDPLAAAARFHRDVLPRVMALLAPSHEGDHDIALIFAPADHTHRGWRLAVVQSLARAHAPTRVNAIESDDPDAIAAAELYLARAPGVTGQLLTLDGNGAGEVLS